MTQPPTRGDGGARAETAPVAPLGAVAAKGSAINAAQWLFNKAMTAAAMLVLTRLLLPEDYGVASQALAIVQFMVILLPLSMGDVLISHPRRFETLVPTARRLALAVGTCTTLVILLAIPLFIGIYDKYPGTWLATLIAIASLRPTCEAILVVPLARLRIGLQFRRIAWIDGSIQFVATLSSLMCGWLGLRSASLVAPQIFGVGARALWYAHSGGAVATAARPSRRIGWFLLRSYLPAALAQYLHSVLVMLEVLVLGLVAGGFQTGLFAFAFQIAAQLTTVVAYQLAVVLQPIFGHLNEDPPRQVAGFLRVQRVLALVCVPLSLMQVVLAEPLFRLAFPDRYLPAITVFQIVSLAQAFYFATAPSMSCLRSQRRFGTFLAWQGVQLGLSIPLYWLGARWNGAIGVAAASAAVWIASAPLVVWLCTRVVPGRLAGAMFAIFVKPWLVSVPVFAAAHFVVRWCGDQGHTGDIAALLGVGPLAVVIVLVILARLDPDVRVISARALAKVRSQFSRN